MNILAKRIALILAGLFLIGWAMVAQIPTRSQTTIPRPRQASQRHEGTQLRCMDEALPSLQAGSAAQGLLVLCPATRSEYRYPTSH